MNFAESTKCGVRRIPILGTLVNKPASQNELVAFGTCGVRQHLQLCYLRSVVCEAGGWTRTVRFAIFPKCLEKYLMDSQPKWSNYSAGLEVLGQEYLSHLSELSSTPSLSEAQLREARKNLSGEHSLSCSQERQAIIAQSHSDRAAARERYLQAEWRNLQLRQEGQLAKMLGSALPGESPQELQRLAEEDRLRAKEGLVALSGPGEEISYKRLDELVPEDRGARLQAELMHSGWMRERRLRRLSLG
jgi:hypothetical protein